MTSNEFSEDNTRRIGEWDVGSILGSGSFAVVWKAKHRSTGQHAAIKEINLTKLNSRLRQSLESEVSILKRISHPHIVMLLEVLESHGRLYLIMEYCAGGDLAHLIKTHGKLSEHLVRSIMRDLASGLHEMYMHHLVHVSIFCLYYCCMLAFCPCGLTQWSVFHKSTIFLTCREI